MYMVGSKIRFSKRHATGEFQPGRHFPRCVRTGSDGIVYCGQVAPSPCLHCLFCDANRDSQVCDVALLRSA